MTTTRARLAALPAAAVLLAGCATVATPTSHATGRVDDRTVALAAPALLVAAPDPDAGFTPAPDRPRSSPTAVPAVRITDAAPLGTRVRAGDVVAHVDAAAQDAALEAARADAALAERRVELLEANAADVRDKRADLVGKRGDLTRAIDTLTDKRAELRTARTDLLAKRADLDARLPALEAKRAETAKGVQALTAQRAELARAIKALRARRAELLAAPDSPEKAAALAALDAQLAQATAGLAKLEAALAQASGGLAQLDAGLAQARAGAQQLAAALAKLDAGRRTLETNLAKARDGLAKVDDGLDQLSDAATRLTDATELARITGTTTALALTRADQQRGGTALVAPADGVVVRTSLAGDVVAPGAPVVEIRPDATPVTTWLPPDAAASTCVGATATVITDWGTTHPATVATVGVLADYPPTAQATDEVHMTRAVRVTLTTDEPLPPGAPVDLTLSPCKEH